MRNLNHILYFGVVGLVFAAAAFIRFRVAPLSAGPDVAQFWGFAEAFRIHGIDFYRFADASDPAFPFRFWEFVYPPFWLLILGAGLLAVPLSSAMANMVDAGWRIAEKTPIILSDLAIGGLLYWAVPGPRYVKLIFASLWLFSPAAWYNSSVFGQFDAIAAAFLLASVILVERGHDRWAFILAALAGLTKQDALIPAAVMVIALIKRLPRRQLLTDTGIMAGLAAVICVPFLYTGNIVEFARSVFFPGQVPGYQEPLMYAFNGFASLLTYFHIAFGWDTAGYFVYFVPVLVAAVIAIMVTVYLNRISYIRAALAGILVFIVLFYRINYQYLVMVIPLALLVAAITPYRSERIIALALALLPSGWLWMFNVSFWFTYLKPVSDWIVPIFDRLGLTRMDVPDYAFVSFSLALTLLALTYIIGTFLLWKLPLKSLVKEEKMTGEQIKLQASYFKLRT